MVCHTFSSPDVLTMSQTSDKILSRLAALIGLIPIYMERLHGALSQFLHRT